MRISHLSDNVWSRIASWSFVDRNNWIRMDQRISLNLTDLYMLSQEGDAEGSDVLVCSYLESGSSGGVFQFLDSVKGAHPDAVFEWVGVVQGKGQDTRMMQFEHVS